MLKYALKPRSGKSAKAYGRGIRASDKTCRILCKKLSGMSVKRGRSLLERMIAGRDSLDGKYYTGASQEMLELIKQASANAEFKGLEPDTMIIKASSHNGFAYWRPRRWNNRRTQRKLTNLQVVLEVR